MPPAFDFPASPTVGQRYDTGTGTAYVWDGVAWKGEGGSTPLTNGQRVIVYNTPGTVAYVKPSNLKSLQVEIWGGGGGGGGCGLTAATTVSAGGGGGGAGYCKTLYKASDLASSEPLVIGEGGVGGTVVPAVGGAAGTDSTFKAMIAVRGNGGLTGGASSAPVTSYRGSVNTPTGGDQNIAGSYGWPGQRFPNSQPGSAIPGAGGAAYGWTQVAFNAVSTNYAPGPHAFGCGGHGGANGFSQAADIVGGKGGDGYAILTEYYFETDQVPNGPAYDNLTIGSNPSTTSFLRVLGADNLGPHVELETGSSDTDFGPNFNFYRNVIGETEFLGDISWYNNSNAGAKTEMAAIWATNYTITNPGDSSEIIVGTRNAGTWRDLLTLYGSVVELTQGRLLFPAVQNPSTTPNMLDDYEEGVFTPVIEGSTAAGVGTYSSQSGRYTKIGNKVFFEANLTWSAHTGTGDIKYAGLPFTSAATFGPPLSIYCSGLTFAGQITGYVSANVTFASFRTLVTNATAGTLVIDTAAQISIAGTYQVA